MSARITPESVHVRVHVSVCVYQEGGRGLMSGEILTEVRYCCGLLQRTYLLPVPVVVHVR